jgi:hypothetical protein
MDKMTMMARNSEWLVQLESSDDEFDTLNF